MPHFFIRTNAMSPNPGPWTHEKAKAVCDRHHGKLVHLWHDDPESPGVAYMLVEEGNLDGLTKDLHAHEVLTLHNPR
jgi:hypothetical protein